MVDIAVGGASSGGGGGGGGAMSAMAFLSLAQGITGAYAQYQRGRAKKIIAKANKRLAEMRADDAIRRGQERVSASRGKFKKLIGSQRTAIAAQGIRGDVGSAMDIQEETHEIGELDALVIRNNAAREAFGYQTEALSATAEGRIASLRGTSGAFDTLSTGVLRSTMYMGG